ncbi:hormogonium polysaccharide secretion pseudopilin HpsB [Planktothrix agardhii 1029]|uniref:hormogonium polysaccharide secretion pseudopilin HpsB n=1 Tax=Planktothrix agardhii TaxID=1160 RepID=UPI001F461CCC|nr:hormogonium polysaccharide secretion pseudopilin HpsB [Planktothrix agardhii]MCF3578823.1 hormogonium polysaccharide secretion pseudopilin HpsB [Planktothrix agardhii 1812]MCF3587915.1 hormogonium polysaccharide secretion pseudopilin HpsB [Planktothrix agardhii 1029]MCF3622807.1 hormogonium polysaccharide secretion pseudopilin HpsB [Planktothrix agardhii 1030]
MIKLKSFYIAGQSSEAGYTILEGVMAIVVASVMLALVGPVIAFSVGTRVQAKRVELSAQAGKTYIDAVKSGVVAPPTLTTTALQSVGVPSTGTLTCDAGKLCTAPTSSGYQLYCVDFDGSGTCTTDSVNDMIVQGAAYHPTAGAVAASGYSLGVRIYRANSFAAGITLSPPIKSDSLVTNALGDRKLPLAQMTTEVSPTGTSSSSFNDLKDRLK